MDAVPSIDRLTQHIPQGSPLERLNAASRLAGRLRARSDELLDYFVDDARASGSSWTEIGGALGTSKQAAQQRFGVLGTPPTGQIPFGLTGAAAEALSVAETQARELGHHYVRPEHLILALAEQPEELSGRALAELGVTAREVRAEIERRLGSGPARPTGTLGVSPQTKRLLELARAIAKSLGHGCPRSEHVLLAAISPKLHSPAASLLAECGAEPAQILDLVTRTLVKEAPELVSRMHFLGRIRMRGL